MIKNSKDITKKPVTRKKRKTKRHVIGRPTVFTQETLTTLQEAFMLGCSYSEACLLAKITYNSLYNYFKANPEYLDKVTLWRENPTLTARRTVVRAISGYKMKNTENKEIIVEPDSALAFNYLKAKKYKEFKEGIDAETNTKNTVIPEEQEDRINQLKKWGIIQE